MAATATGVALPCNDNRATWLYAEESTHAVCVTGSSVDPLPGLSMGKEFCRCLPNVEGGKESHGACSGCVVEGPIVSHFSGRCQHPHPQSHTKIVGGGVGEIVGGNVGGRGLPFRLWVGGCGLSIYVCLT